MPLISDRTGILRPKEEGTFIDRFQNLINTRISGMEGAAALTLLHDIRGNLLAEESAVNRSVSGIEALLNTMESVNSDEELGGLSASFHQLAAEQFKNRASASTFHAHYARFMELLISYATATATTTLKAEGIDLQNNSWCILVSGELGRGEPSRRTPGRLILLTEDSETAARESFNMFAYRTLAILEPLITQEGKKPAAGRRHFWSGSTAEWRAFVDAGLTGRGHSAANSGTLADQILFADTFSLVADLRPLCGAQPLAKTVIGSSRQRVALELAGESFWEFARQTAAMPVAIGIFGKFKTARKGKHRGEIALEDMALSPLIAAIRVLAFSAGITETSTVDRIKGILATGNLGVTLADRLLTAYHAFMKMLIERELSEKLVNEKIFVNPDDMDELSRELFRAGLEDIATLQRLVYQHLVEVD